MKAPAFLNGSGYRGFVSGEVKISTEEWLLFQSGQNGSRKKSRTQVEKRIQSGSVFLAAAWHEMRWTARFFLIHP